MAEAKPKIIRVEDSENLAREALHIFIDDAKKAIESNGVCRIAISGGHTPEHFYELISNPENSKNLDWHKIHIFWVDERCVPPESKASNFRLAQEKFLSKIDIPEKNIHRVHAESKDYASAAGEYEEDIRQTFNISRGQIPEFDLMVLGMGADGHIGSLFPNSFAVFDTEHLAVAVYMMNDQFDRITLTHPVMRAAKHLMVMISGGEKAEIVKEVLAGEPDEAKYPVHTLWPILERVSWLVDADAAKMLD